MNPTVEIRNSSWFVRHRSIEDVHQAECDWEFSIIKATMEP